MKDRLFIYMLVHFLLNDSQDLFSMNECLRNNMSLLLMYSRVPLHNVYNILPLILVAPSNSIVSIVVLLLIV